MSLIHNERTKLLATAINSAAVSSFTVGVLAPIAAAFYQVGNTSVPTGITILGTGIWIFAALAIHLAARVVLAGLRE